MATPRNRGLVVATGVAMMVSLGLAVAGFRGLLPSGFGVLGIGLFVACLGLLAVLGLSTRRGMLAQRDEAARGQMIVMLAARLRDEETAKLEEMARKGGPAAEAARMILQGRAERAHAPTPPA